MFEYLRKYVVIHVHIEYVDCWKENKKNPKLVQSWKNQIFYPDEVLLESILDVERKTEWLSPPVVW